MKQSSESLQMQMHPARTNLNRNFAATGGTPVAAAAVAAAVAAGCCCILSFL